MEPYCNYLKLPVVNQMLLQPDSTRVVFCYRSNPVHAVLLSNPIQINKKTYTVQGEFCRKSSKFNIVGFCLCQDGSLSKPRMPQKLMLAVE